MVSTFLPSILKVLPIISLVLIGFIIKRINFIQKESVSDIRKLVLNLALPCLVYTAFYRLQLEKKLLVIILTISLVSILMILIGNLIGKALCIKNPYFPLLFGSFEPGMMGYSMFTAIYGANEIGKLAVMDLGQVFFIFFIWMPLLTKKSQGIKGIKNILKSFFTSPIVIAIFLGVITSLTASQDFYNNQVFLSLFDVVNKLANLTIPLVTTIIGYELEISRSHVKLPLITIACRMTLLICFSLIINKYIISTILGLPKIYESALFTMFILPPSFIATLFIKDGDEENNQYVINTLSISILASLTVFITSIAF